MKIPHVFVLDALCTIETRTNPMFGCLAVYVGPRIVLALRDKDGSPEDNGVWLATTAEEHESLRREFPSMRSIRVLGKAVTGWQVLPASAPDFEEAALQMCIRDRWMTRPRARWAGCWAGWVCLRDCSRCRISPSRWRV